MRKAGQMVCGCGESFVEIVRRIVAEAPPRVADFADATPCVFGE